MKYNFWKIDVICTEDGKVYPGKNEPVQVQTLEVDTEDFFQYMQEHYDTELVWNDDWMEPFELDEYYYVIDEDFTQFHVFSAHKGYTFYDTAEHDDRVRIAVAFKLTKQQAHIL